MTRHRKPITRTAEYLEADRDDDQMYACVTRMHDSNHFDVMCYTDARSRRARRPGRMRAGRTRTFIDVDDIVVVRTRPGCSNESVCDILHVYRDPAHVRMLIRDGLIPSGTTVSGRVEHIAESAFDWNTI